MKVALLVLTKGGKAVAERLTGLLPGSRVLNTDSGLKVALKNNWHNYDAFVCIMATGIVVRCIAPLLKDKTSDPCVIVLDEKANNVISLLSGHLGGGNKLTLQIATLLHSNPVITTSSDTQGLTALDLWAKKQSLTVERSETMTTASSLLVNNGSLKLFSEHRIKSLPEDIVSVPSAGEADVIITHSKPKTGLLHFHPKTLVVGIGCNRNTPLEEFEEALNELFSDLNFSRCAIRNLASIDVKNDEVGLLEFGEKNGWKIEFFSRDEINRVTDIEVSSAALKAVGAIGVAEPTALLSSNNTLLISRKRKWQNITMAVATAPFMLSEQVPAE